jgi:hypothetical protein
MATLLKVLNNLPIPNRRGVLHFASELRRASLRATLPSGTSCQFCGVRAEAERQAIQALAGRFAASDARAFDTLSALCLPHMIKLAAELQNENPRSRPHAAAGGASGPPRI